ncbi:hypothetical protein GCM10023321_14820 [Pseudonocardia eucalypti]|uniref:Uncharacterized protein n=1 Tax=Pseudonocardia eucalypti TaxID=648755 RepID=A0ABP9PPY1_9PSEU
MATDNPDNTASMPDTSLTGAANPPSAVSSTSANVHTGSGRAGIHPGITG